MAPQRIQRRAVQAVLHRLVYQRPQPAASSTNPPCSFLPQSISSAVPQPSAPPSPHSANGSLFGRLSHSHGLSQVSRRSPWLGSRAAFSSEAGLARNNPVGGSETVTGNSANDPDRPPDAKQAQPHDATQDQPQDIKQDQPQDSKQSQPSDAKPATKAQSSTGSGGRRLAKSLARQGDLPNITQVLDNLVHGLLVLPENLAIDPRPSGSAAAEENVAERQEGGFAGNGKEAETGPANAVNALAAAQGVVEGSSSSGIGSGSGADVEASAEALEPFARENERSLNSLLRFLNSLGPHNFEHPPAGTMNLTFYLKPGQGTTEGVGGGEEGDAKWQEEAEGGVEVAAVSGGSASGEGLAGLRKVQLRIRTTGGNCKDLVGRQLSEFFQDCGVSSRFVWPEGYWNLLSPAAVAEQLKKEAAEAEAAAAAAEASAAASAASAAKPQQQQQRPGLDAALIALDGALAAIASAPWHESAEDKKRIEEQLLSVLVADGWRVGESVKRMWAGERDVRKLSLGLDEGSAKMVGRVLGHLEGYDKEHGKMVYLAEGVEEVGKGEGGDGGSEKEGVSGAGKVVEPKGSLKVI